MTRSTAENIYILGIETSCDETAVAIVRGDGHIMGQALLSQIDDHQKYGGVVPEIAARQHIRHLDHLLKGMIAKAGVKLEELTAVAATTGPGLIGGLMVGVMTAKALAKSLNKPFIAVNHLEGHALTARLSDDVPFPFLLLLVSGGHCQILEVRDVGSYNRLGTTIDDAAGEAFDKTAKLLGLPYPGGPSVEAAARDGDAQRFRLPRPLLSKAGCDFSFSGLKTAVRLLAQDCAAREGRLTQKDRADICAAFQLAVGDCLINRLGHAINQLEQKARKPDNMSLVVAGGVAANQALRARLRDFADSHRMRFVAPPLALCTDNGVMIAWAGFEQWRQNPTIDHMDVAPRPRWPLDTESDAKVGGGKKGAKA